MKSDTLTLVSIIIVNYNGKKFLHQCFSSLYELDFPKSKFEIILVDNNSKDLSAKYTKENFPQVKVVQSPANLGFAGGCNLGVRESLGKYIVLLNNDTKVDKSWLTNLVKRLESSDKIAAVNSKLLLYYPFVEFFINSDIHLRSDFTPSTNFQSVGVLIENVVLENNGLQSLVQYNSGFYEKDKGLITTRWTSGNASLLIPCDPNSEELNLTFTIRSEKLSSNLKTSISICQDTKELVSAKLGSHEVKQYEISLKTKDIKDNFLYAVQNTGVVVFRNGYGRDRGAVVKEHSQFYEIDNTFYDQSVELNAFSGASVIIKKDVYEKLGGFDESFFMYYEDVDLSLRMKRMGWEIVYEPKSVVYHIHSGTSSEWSPLFIFNVEKNHLATIIKHFPFIVVTKEFVMYLLTTLISLYRVIKFRFKDNWEEYDVWRDRLEIRLKVWVWIIQNLTQLVIKRISFSRTGKMSIFQVFKELY